MSGSGMSGIEKTRVRKFPDPSLADTYGSCTALHCPKALFVGERALCEHAQLSVGTKLLNYCLGVNWASQ